MARLITLRYWKFFVLFYIACTVWYVFSKFLLYTYNFTGGLIAIALGLSLFEIVRCFLPKRNIFEDILLVSCAFLGYKTGSDFLQHALVNLEIASHIE